MSSQTGELNDAGKGKQKGLFASEVKPTDTVDDAIAAVIESPTLAGQQPTRRFAEKAAAAMAKADAVASEIKQAVKDLGKLIAREYARTLIGLGTAYGVAMMLGMLWDDDDEDKPTISFDPLSSDFGKIRFGDTRVDPLAAITPLLYLFADEHQAFGKPRPRVSYPSLTGELCP